jgi:antirestriction protein ArdC
MKVEEIITARIIEKLEQGTVPWHRPWAGGEAPKNLITKKEYRGVNVFILNAMGHGSPFWVSFKQAQELGGNVKKGEHGTPIVFWKWLNKKDDDGNITSDKFPFLRYYTVFNVDQVEGIDESKIPELAIKYNELERIEKCENVVMSMPKRPEITYHEQRAYYKPSTDSVNMPKMETFDGSEEYYSTLFHELTHSTGHQSRLNRKGIISGIASFGSQEYSKEELVAEMGAAFLCGYCQIENKTIDNSAAYIKSWLRTFKDDAKMVIMAAAQAQKASDFILGKNEAAA